GFSTAPLLVGPLADRFGRKPALVVGLLTFALCGLGAAFAPSIGLLLGLRLVQGAGAGHRAEPWRAHPLCRAVADHLPRPRRDRARHTRPRSRLVSRIAAGRRPP